MSSSSEYTNSLSSNMNDYSSLGNYNTVFGPPLPSGVPSMHYPTLPRPDNPFGYNALTHNNDEGTYLSISSAYGKDKEPGYYVGKCPSNRFYNDFPPVSPTPTPTPLVEGYVSGSTDSKIKDLQIHVFVLKNCIFCHKLKELFQKHHAFHLVKWIDAHDPNYQDLLKNVRGFPYIYSNLTKKSITGYSDSLDSIITQLE